ncbi:MAG: hypothetical protein M3536_03370 [Actinomycetota bacterium]|nr:hypothetical protein [Actinomycetota bacterium]
MSYYLEDNPNTKLAQYGWPRTKVSGVIGVHTTESGVFPAGSDPGAENTAGYISVRANHGSYHALADWDSRIKLVRPRYAAWADITNNAHAMSVSGAMNAARWRDLTPERAAGIVRNMAIAAAELVLDAIADGLLDSPPPARRMTAQQAIDGSAAGFYGHGETNPGTRYDPGQNFDWDLFLTTYAAAIGGTITPQGTTTPEEDDMPFTFDDLKRAATEGALAALDHKVDNTVGGKTSVLDVPRIIDARFNQVPGAVLDEQIPRAGEFGGNTSLRGVLAYADQKHIEALRAAVAAARSDGTPIEAIIKAVQDTLAAGVKITVEAGK